MLSEQSEKARPVMRRRGSPLAQISYVRAALPALTCLSPRSASRQRGFSSADILVGKFYKCANIASWKTSATKVITSPTREMCFEASKLPRFGASP